MRTKTPAFAGQSFLLLTLVGAAVLLTPLGILQAQTVSASGDAEGLPKNSTAAAGLDEIVVTATRQEVSINRVPISVTALNEQNLDVQGIKSIDDLSRSMPGLYFERGNPGFDNANQSVISIRGVESTVGASTTGIYIDDTPIQTRNAGYTSTSVYPAVFDLDRVEVLRGPQGTLFGAGAEGGAVRFITPQPSLNQYSSYNRAEVATTKDGDPTYEIGSAFGGPVVDGLLGFRVSAFYRHEGGWIDQVNDVTDAVVDPRFNTDSTTVVRGALTWAPTDALKITPSVYYQDLTANAGSAYWEKLSNPSEGVFQSGSRLASPSSDHFSLSAVKVDWKLDGMQLISNTSYLARSSAAYPDYTNFVRAVTTGAPFPLLPGEYSQGNFIDRQNGFTEELRLQSSDPNSRLNWVAGVFFNRTTQLDEELVSSPQFPQMVLDTFGVDYLSIFGSPLGPDNSVYTDIENTVDKQVALFGQADYSITERFKATVGLRAARTDFSFISSNAGPFAGIATDSGAQSQTPVTPKYGLSFQADPDNLYYASAAKGFRPGGAERVPPVVCAPDLDALGLSKAPGTYNADSDWGYELGAKNRLLSGNLQLSASVFYITWSGIQQSVTLPSCGQSFVANIGEAISRGFDFNPILRVPGGVTLSLLVGYTDAYFAKTEQSGTAFIAIKGDPISQISPWTVRASGQYDFSIGQHDAFLHLDDAYQNKGPTPDLRVYGTSTVVYTRPAFSWLSMRAGVKFGQASVALFVDNLTNENKELSRTTVNGNITSLIYGNSNRPRTIGLTFIYAN